MCKSLIWLICSTLVMSLATGATADLLVHYPFDETSGTIATDVSGNGFDGVINGSTNWVEGFVGGALEFTRDCNVTLPAADMGLTSFVGSVAFWSNDSVPSDIYTMFWGGDNTTGTGFGPENEMHIHVEKAGDAWSGGELSFFIFASPNPNVHLHSDPAKGDAEHPGNPPVDPILMGDQAWHHVAGIWDGDAGVAKLYIDGIPIMEWAYEPNIYELSNIYLGQMAAANRTYDGMLDEVRIYSNALSDDEVYLLYDNPGDHVNESPAAKPQEFVLNQNYPNPFNPTTTISYALPKNEYVQIRIFDALGQAVRTLVAGDQNAGNHQITWDSLDDSGSPVSSGVYIYTMTAGGQSETRKLLLIR